MTGLGKHHYCTLKFRYHHVPSMTPTSNKKDEEQLKYFKTEYFWPKPLEFLIRLTERGPRSVFHSKSVSYTVKLVQEHRITS